MDVDHQNSGHITRPKVNIPPRKLLSSARSPLSPRRDHTEKDYCYDSDSDDPYAGDHFRMYEFKIRRCTRSRSHDWTDCPFSHPGEKARRRDPRRFHYVGDVCPEFRHGENCSRGDECGFAHGVFECWLHPSRYRTEACKDGKHCMRKVCFFAHSSRQLRVLPPENSISSAMSSSPASVLSCKNSHCCLLCSHSPTSILFPADKTAPFSRLSRCRSAATGSLTYKEVLNEMITSLDSFSFTEPLTAASSSEMLASSNLINHHQNHLTPWLDVGDRDLQSQQSSLQFALSPSTPSYLNSQFEQPRQSFFTPRGTAAAVMDKNSFEVGSNGDPDFQWVDDLLT